MVVVNDKHRFPFTGDRLTLAEARSPRPPFNSVRKPPHSQLSHQEAEETFGIQIGEAAGAGGKDSADFGLNDIAFYTDLTSLNVREPPPD